MRTGRKSIFFMTLCTIDPKLNNPRFIQITFHSFGHLRAHSFIIQSFFFKSPRVVWCQASEIWKQRHLVIVRKTPSVTSNDGTKGIWYQIQQSRYGVQLVFSFLLIPREAKRLAFLSGCPSLTPLPCFPPCPPCLASWLYLKLWFKVHAGRLLLWLSCVKYKQLLSVFPRRYFYISSVILSIISCHIR